MKYLVLIVLVVVMFSCGSTTKTVSTLDKEKPVRIANDSLEYELIVFDFGFNTFLKATAQPRGFYTHNYLRVKNNAAVITYNIRANQPTIYGDVYAQPIDYESRINYGYEVDYLLFNYFLFFQQKYNQLL